jgi:predicted  nucleic acid-binding Zn-ribbon protein
MTEGTENLVLEMLRRIRASQERMELDMVDIKARLTGVEISVGQLTSQLASQSLRLDRIEERVARIERRLDLVDA